MSRIDGTRNTFHCAQRLSSQGSISVYLLIPGAEGAKTNEAAFLTPYDEWLLLLSYGIWPGTVLACYHIREGNRERELKINGKKKDRRMK